ncbi:WW domain binding protein 1-like b [Chanos chanos]|uniref:WW domain binding protein 1-like b n=1 Tax=Chanos chanos TaxID=29144 RepID=A0A6J2VVT0_CHACN|nr:WW domain binding protein 1-like [Chanos chanos]
MTVEYYGKMGLFLYAVGSVSPTEASVLEVVHCEGVNNQSYVCESGHCCGESQCCSYYYELWWFWLVWAVIFILSCCCVCHHRRTKHRLQQQQRQHEINLIAYREAHNYTSIPFYFRFLPSYLLPDYEEVVNRPPTPPPPYSAVNIGPSPAVSPLTTEPQEGHCPSRQATPVPPVSDTLCSRSSTEEIHSPGDYSLKANSKTQSGLERSGSGQIALPLEETSSVEKREDCRKELLRDVAVSEEKDRVLGRHRRFTGDSGIEVCVCGRGSGVGGGVLENREAKEMEGLLSEEEQEDDSAEFCEGCGHRSYGDVEQGLVATERSAEHGASPVSQPHSVCLYLHTIEEQEGPHHGNGESQS